MAEMTNEGEHPDVATVRAYTEAIGPVVNRLLAASARGWDLLDRPDRGFDNPVWRAETLAALRDWQLVDALPSAPPPPASELHARVLRWFGAVAVRGAAITAAVEAADPVQMQAALDGAREILGAARDVLERSRELRRRVGLPGRMEGAEE